MVINRLANFGLLIHRAVEKGFLLFGAAILALLIANSSYSDIYHDILTQYISINIGNHSLSLSFLHWINDFLMAIFFLVVGTEIKRELIAGHLSSPEQRLIPVIAALGGVVCPILIYLFFNYNHTIAIKGWAIPGATDIAFALGVLMLFGQSLPGYLKVFLTALAIIDDLIAILMIAFFYTNEIAWYYIICMVACLMLLLLMNRYNVSYVPLYMFIGLIMWYCCYCSGIHATISGVILGLAIPLYIGDNYSPLRSVEKSLAPFVSYIILPLFALANSGIMLENFSFQNILHPITLGVAVGLFVGKQLGIFAAIFMLEKSGMLQNTVKISLLQYYAVSVICGIGFTMSLFISILAFHENQQLVDAKLGVMIGSLLSCIYGGALILIARPKVNQA